MKYFISLFPRSGKKSKCGVKLYHSTSNASRIRPKIGIGVVEVHCYGRYKVWKKTNELTKSADINNKAPKATATIIDVAQVASIGVLWNSSPGITTVYSRFSLNLVNGIELLSDTREDAVILWFASGRALRLRPWPKTY